MQRPIAYVYECVMYNNERIVKRDIEYNLPFAINKTSCFVFRDAIMDFAIIVIRH